MAAQAGAALATGNAAVLFHPDPGVAEALAKLFIKAGVDKNAIAVVETGTDATLADVVGAAGIEAVAYAGPLNFAAEINRTLAAADAAIRPVIYFREDPAMDAGAGQPLAGSPNYVERFVHERSLSIDTTASGGNASLLSIEDGGTSLPGEA